MLRLRGIFFRDGYREKTMGIEKNLLHRRINDGDDFSPCGKGCQLYYLFKKMNKKVIKVIMTSVLIAIASDRLLVILGRELLIETLNLDPWVEVQLGEIIEIIIEIIKLFLSRYNEK